MFPYTHNNNIIIGIELDADGQKFTGAKITAASHGIK